MEHISVEQVPKGSWNFLLRDVRSPRFLRDSNRYGIVIELKVHFVSRIEEIGTSLKQALQPNFRALMDKYYEHFAPNLATLVVPRPRLTKKRSKSRLLIINWLKDPCHSILKLHELVLYGIIYGIALFAGRTRNGRQGNHRDGAVGYTRTGGSSAGERQHPGISPLWPETEDARFSPQQSSYGYDEQSQRERQANRS